MRMKYTTGKVNYQLKLATEGLNGNKRKVKILFFTRKWRLEVITGFFGGCDVTAGIANY